MCILLRFPLEQCRPAPAYGARRAGEIVIFPGVRIERDAFSLTEDMVETAAQERREG